MSIHSSRRKILTAAAGAWASSLVPAWALEKTPRLTEGPFYPRAVDMPLDDDNDLTRIRGKDGVASGALLDLTGRLVDSTGKILPAATVEIWQCNSHGKYHDGRDDSTAPRDPFFQGFGKTVTDDEGRFRFRTIRPVAYPGRVPHIHFKVKHKGSSELTSQLFVAGDPGLENDFVWRAIASAELKKQMAIKLNPAAAGSEVAMTGYFEIMLG